MQYLSIRSALDGNDDEEDNISESDDAEGIEDPGVTEENFDDSICEHLRNFSKVSRNAWAKKSLEQSNLLRPLIARYFTTTHEVAKIGQIQEHVNPDHPIMMNLKTAQDRNIGPRDTYLKHLVLVGDLDQDQVQRVLDLLHEGTEFQLQDLQRLEQSIA